MYSETVQRAGLKKGAHYSAYLLLRVTDGVPQPRMSYPAAVLSLLLPGVGRCPAAQPEADARRPNGAPAVKSEIERVTRQVSEEQVERDKLSRELRSAEVSVGKAREGLDGVRRGRAERASRRAALRRRETDAEGDLNQNRSALAGTVACPPT